MNITNWATSGNNLLVCLLLFVGTFFTLRNTSLEDTKPRCGWVVLNTDRQFNCWSWINRYIFETELHYKDASDAQSIRSYQPYYIDSNDVN